MKCCTLVAIILFFAFTIANAQEKKHVIKAHAAVELPIGHFADNYNTGWGLFVTDYYSVTKGGNLVFSLGYSHWKNPDYSTGDGLWQIRTGFQVFPAKAFYLQPDFGLAITRGGAGFQYGFGPGYLFKLKEKGSIDVSLHINRLASNTWLSFGAGYQF